MIVTVKYICAVLQQNEGFGMGTELARQRKQ
jgi:hypothetical protein